MKITVKKLLAINPKISLLDKEILLSHVIQKSREFLFTNPDFEINFWQKIKFEHLVRQRQKNIPVAYLVGHKEFFGLDFLVNKNVLIPRPDTELMVENALQQINTSTLKHILLIDVGTGSGCIPISILTELKKRNDEMREANFVTNVPDKFRPTQFVTPPKIIAIDISKKALCVAKKNAKKHSVEIEFLHGNLLEPILQKISLNQFNLSAFFLAESMLITANLPYITEQQFKQEPSIQHEPKLALVADNNGLALYEELLKQLSSLARRSSDGVQSEGGFLIPLSSFLEIDPSQTEKIKILIKKYLPEASIEVKKDLSGLDRLVIIT
ncbi:MAG: peptide chain release factor N(5)-glutamine methyltransferase [Patescibacteria group bacterium]|nr:peptide chain release factor N(5)-glutamine methyltransferase [Patescibacteria group bacterium]